MWINFSELIIPAISFLMLSTVVRWIVKRKMEKRWTPARAAELEGILSALVRKVTNGHAAFLSTNGCSYHQSRDFKISFNDQRSESHTLRYDPVGKEIICISSSLNWEFPSAVLKGLQGLFSKAEHYTRRVGHPSACDPEHHLVGISERALRRALNK
jgi:hypothetical protein